MALLIVFLVGVERKPTGSKTSCQVVAGILHYFMLTTFIWMLIEAVILYFKLVKVVMTTEIDEKFKHVSLASWGK